MVRSITWFGLGIIMWLQCSPAMVARAATVNWIDGSSNWGNNLNWSPATVPDFGDDVNIVDNDGVSRTVTYDYYGNFLNSLTIDLTGGTGMATNSLLMSAEYYLTTAGDQVIGLNGSGTFTQSGGTNTLNGGELYLGANSGSTGTYTLSGGTLSNVYTLADTEREIIGNQGTGIFNQTGGTNIANDLALGLYTGSTGTYTLSGSGILSASDEAIGVGGTALFHQSGGTNTTSQLYVRGDNSEYTLSGGLLSVSGAEVIGYDGSATFSQIGGSHVIAGNLTIGLIDGSTGTYLQSAGSLSIDGSEIVGQRGTGTVSQSGGTNMITGNLNLGYIASNCTYTISGGLAAVNGNVYVGGSFSGPGGTGNLMVSGSGVLTVGATLVAYNTPGNVINLSGGTINAPALNFNGMPSVLNWTSGTLNIISPNITWDPTADPTSTSAALGSALTLGANQTLMISGNETIGGTGAFSLTLNSGSTHYVGNGTITLNPTGVITQNPGSTLFYSNFVQAGGTVNGTLQNQGYFNYESGLFNGRLLNQGTVFFDTAFTAGNGVENDAAMTLNSGHTLTVNGQGLDNLGSFTLSGGVISGSGPIVNDYSGTMSAQGTINNASITNYGAMTVGGILNLDGGAIFNFGRITLSPGADIRQNGVSNAGTIQGGGVISAGVTDFAGSLIDANNASAPLVVSNLTSGNPVGSQLEIAPGSSLNIIAAWSNSGLVTLQGTNAVLGGGTITNSGTIQGAGTINSPITNSAGVIRASGGELDLAGTGSTNAASAQIQATTGNTVMYVSGLSSNAGTIALTGGTFDNNAHLLSNPGAINGYGTVRTGGLTINSGGLLSVGGGDMNVLGTVTNNGTVNIQGGRTLYFFNNVNGAGVYTGAGMTDYLATFSPGNSPASVNFAGGVTLGGAASLVMELGGTTPGTQFDQVHVGGTFSLGGTLEVLLINGFTPVTGNSFDLMDWGSLSGAFSALELPNLTGPLAWNTSQLYTTGVLSVVTTYLPGDFNRDGHVDAADILPMMQALANLSSYKAAHSSLTTAQLLEIEDVNGDGKVNNADLQSLLNLLKSGGGSSSPVPEPASWVLAFSALAMVSGTRLCVRCVR